ncbi:MAG: LD-carboxypeptidase, partial [Muribaculaceae bacterium]|nr:LD-carboxypeptidase [Muribaculaceae bacterium]
MKRNHIPAVLAAIILIITMAQCSKPGADTRQGESPAIDTVSTIYPAALKAGDRIAIVSPAGPIDSAIVDSAATVLRDLGYEPVIYPHAFGRNGYFSGTHDERYADLEAAFTDTT